MNTTEVISLIAIIIATISIIFTIVIHQRNIKMQAAIFHVERNVHFEGRLSDWPDAFEFYGIDLNKANEESITRHHINYMVLSINSLKSVATFRNISLTKELETNTYRKYMFSHEKSRLAWKYAQNCFSDDTRKVINHYLETNFS